MVKKIKGKIQLFFESLFQKQSNHLLRQIKFSNDNNALLQRSLMIQIKEAFHLKTDLNIKDYGFRIYSQHDEDGIILYIFSFRKIDWIS